MNISDKIYFDGDKIYHEMPTKVIYKGILIQNSPEEIYMHYGYGLMWDNLQEIKLTKGINGYEGDITFWEYGHAYFCFRTAQNIWDNNDSQNYCIEINKKETTYPITDSISLVAIPELKKGYLIQRKIKITIYKLIVFVGKLFSRKTIKT